MVLNITRLCILLIAASALAAGIKLVIHYRTD